ncbi:MAG TPA: hypothetical protein VF591_20220 [Pyrinomonadaceae bacterium]|jgi:hypothetical protein
MKGHLFTVARVLSAAVVVGFSAASAAAQSGAPDAAAARRYFAEARALCARDRGRLWGRPLCGPMMLADPNTRAVVASGPDGEGLLKPSGEVYVGTLPSDVNIANTAVEWAGVNWMLLISSAVPADRYRRGAMLMHELWHRRQAELGFPASGAANDHLDTREGRVWLQLEWRALATALASRGVGRRRAVSDALLFRARRRSLFARAAAEEREMEMHEGLAEYTGVRLSGSPDPARFVIDFNLAQEAKRESFVRAFAYASGPAYGLLLDEAAPGWTRRLKKDDDLAELLRSGLRMARPRGGEGEASGRARVYGGEELAASERGREEARLRLIAEYRARLVEGPVLSLPLRGMRMSFDPGNLLPLEGLGTVYPNIRVVDAWGVLTVSRGGALLNKTFSAVNVPAPADANARPLRGDGWTLELGDGWTLAPGARARDFVLKKG